MSASDTQAIDGRDAFVAVAWRDFIMWAYTEKGMVAQFNRETGRGYMAQRSPLDALIDKATGRDLEDAEAFIEWVTINWWGEDEAPAAYRAHLASRRVAP